MRNNQTGAILAFFFGGAVLQRNLPDMLGLYLFLCIAAVVASLAFDVAALFARARG